MPMSEDESFLDRVSADVFESVMERGYHIHFINADAASVIHQNRPYAYTVGRSLMEQHEFLVTGLDDSLAIPVLRALVAYDMDLGCQAGQTVALTVDTGDVEAQMDVLLIQANTHPLIGALSQFGPTVKALQALWPRRTAYGPVYPSLNSPWPEQPVHPYGRTPLAGDDPYRGA